MFSAEPSAPSLFSLCHLRIDSTSGTRRLLSTADGVNQNDFYQWTYDRFGNRTNELHIPPGGGNQNLNYTVGSDNRLLSQTNPLDPTSYWRYLTDQAGMRLRKLPRQGHRSEVDLHAAMDLGK